MLTLPPDLVGRDVDLGTVAVTAQQIRRYARAVGDRALAAGPCRVAPLGFALAVRGGPVPAIELAADTISVHAGHVITAHRRLTAPGVYGVRARIADVFEKSGRSGPLTVITRRAELRAPDGSIVTTVDDQQIVRRRHRTASEPPQTAPAPPSDDPRYRKDRSAVLGVAADLEVGALIGPQHRPAPSATAIAAYARSLRGREPLFTDRAFARALGYADVIVPGPLQSALLEAMLRRRLRGWELHRLALTFRVSVIAREPIALAAVVVERHLRRDGTTLLCDLALENRDGERAALGTAELHGP